MTVHGVWSMRLSAQVTLVHTVLSEVRMLAIECGHGVQVTTKLAVTLKK